jgi:phosphatidylserine decarboxylase
LKNEGLPIVQEGFPFLGLFGLLTLVFLISGYWVVAVPGLVLTAFTAWFFRNPERLPPIGARVVASPADGRVIYVGKAKEADVTGEERLKISVFMSVFDVHVNRFPVDGTVKKSVYKRGKFLAAFENSASLENERNAVLIETNDGSHVVVTQVAGLVARRIVFYPSVGGFLMKGQRFGLIRFGSRTDLYLPAGSQSLVRVGDRVLGGETAIAELPEKTA